MSQSHLTSLPPICAALLDGKAAKGLTFEAIAKALGRDEIYVASIFYGQAKATPEELQQLTELTGVSHDSLQSELGDAWFPHRGLGPIPPTDPTLYRFYEGLLVYGNPIKAVIHEKFGDGIMSMIDCKVHVDKKPDPKGDRVVVTFDGKFMPYKKW